MYKNLLILWKKFIIVSLRILKYLEIFPMENNKKSKKKGQLEELEESTITISLTLKQTQYRELEGLRKKKRMMHVQELIRLMINNGLEIA